MFLISSGRPSIVAFSSKNSNHHYNIKTAPDNFSGYPVPIILKNGFMLAVSRDILPNV